jgi:hypothetical protein
MSQDHIEFCPVPRLRELFGLPVSTAYKLEAAGEIRFVRLRKKGAITGKTLVDCESVREFYRRQMETNKSAGKVPWKASETA